MSTSAISRSVGAPVLSGCRTFLTGAVVLLAGASCTNATVSSPAPIAGNGQGGDQGGNIVDPTVVAEGALFVLLPAEPAEPRSQNSWRPRTVAMACGVGRGLRRRQHAQWRWVQCSMSDRGELQMSNRRATVHKHGRMWKRNTDLQRGL